MIFHSNTIFSCLGLKGPLGAQSYNTALQTKHIFCLLTRAQRFFFSLVPLHEKFILFVQHCFVYLVKSMVLI